MCGLFESFSSVEQLSTDVELISLISVMTTDGICIYSSTDDVPHWWSTAWMNKQAELHRNYLSSETAPAVRRTAGAPAAAAAN